MKGFHTFVVMTLCSRDGSGWTIDFELNGVGFIISDATPEKCFEKALRDIRGKTDRNPSGESRD